MSDSDSKGQLGRDFAVFLQPGFLVTILLLAVLCAMVAGAILWGNVLYGISPF
jgi:hypothetical protein